MVFTCSKPTIETLEQGVKCSKFKIMTPEQRHPRRSNVVIVSFEHVFTMIKAVGGTFLECFYIVALARVNNKRSYRSSFGRYLCI